MNLPLISDEAFFEAFDAEPLNSYHEKSVAQESHPSDLLDIPGLVRDVSKYTLEIAQRPNRALAFAGAVSLISALAGRIYTDRFNSRTNLYVIAIAGSATGKNAPRQTNQRIFQELQLNEIASVFGSGEGLEDLLKSTPRHLFQTDEIDGLMEELSSGGQSRNTSLNTKLLQIFTDSAGVYSTRPLAGKPPSTIVNPSLSIFGTATPYSFYNSISDRLIKNGLIGRCLVIDASKRQPRQSSDWKPIPSRIISDATTIIEQGGTQGDALDIGGTSPNSKIEPCLVHDDAEAKKELTKLYDFEDDMMDNTEGIYEVLWGRYCEMVNKLNLIYAISQNPQHPVITKQAVDFSASFVRYSIEHIINSLRSYSSEDGDRRGKVYDLINESGKDGIKRSELMRKGKFTTRELDDFLHDLFEMGCIRSERSPTKGRSAEIYFA